MFLIKCFTNYSLNNQGAYTVLLDSVTILHFTVYTLASLGSIPESRC